MTIELLQQVRLLDAVETVDRVVDVLIEDGLIQAIEPQIDEVPPDAQIYTSQGLVLGSGLVDLYSHSGEPGFEERETLESLGQAAIAGGFTRLNILPDTEPTIDNPATVNWFKTQNSKLSCWGALTLGVKGQQMTELSELAESGVVGFADGQPIANLALMRRLLEYLQPLQKPVALWACDRSLVGNGVVREGVESIRFGLPGNPAMSETTALSALLECVEEIGTPVHLMRISTARSVELVRAAKARGLPITASVTWMHLLLSTKSIEHYDPNLRLEPPLGNQVDQVALRKAVKEGVIDAIAIDHTPYTYEEKTLAFSEAPPGAIGLELALPLLWQTLVDTQQWSALELWRSLSTRPAACLGQKMEAIVPGQPAELTLFDPQLSWSVNGQSLKSRSRNTPWLGKPLVGRVIRTWCP
ncbi:dihydroorotase [Phormidesmis priestleyi ULC007]|uniref:Dihydroorotase n=1 Tax=Phormidesmis priestleyi ULC007 TaxID=1920490 RepID=A0A2T1DLG4_9CYAN|nr:dihydroorotase [Phormidesmis priestleyi]PSB21295.1 dihydroorotase [Phormidesmis priestleyi ULC007]PZO50666.1 MAG: dihydroorotase [Phormidesmis priestleyi]